MSQIEVPSWVVEVAAEAISKRHLSNTGMPFPISACRDDARAALTAALGAWVVPVGKVCMNGRRYGHGMFADIEVQYPTTTTPGPKIGSDLYTLRQEKPE